MSKFDLAKLGELGLTKPTIEQRPVKDVLPYYNYQCRKDLVELLIQYWDKEVDREAVTLDDITESNIYVLQVFDFISELNYEDRTISHIAASNCPVDYIEQDSIFLFHSDKLASDWFDFHQNELYYDSEKRFMPLIENYFCSMLVRWYEENKLDLFKAWYLGQIKQEEEDL